MEETYVSQAETPAPLHLEEKPRKKIPLWVIAIVVFVLVLLTGGVVLVMSQKSVSSTSKSNSTKTPTNSTQENAANINQSNNKTDADTSIWNTYTSPTKKFSFKYPSDGTWTMPISSNSSSVACQKNCPKPYNIKNFTSQKTDKTSIEQFILSLNTTNINLHPYISDYKLITINGVNAVEVLIPAQPGSTSGPTVEIFIVIDGVGYLYTYTYIDPALNSVTKLDNLPDPNPNILSTLQIGNQTSTTANTTATWKTYVNSKWGLSLQYPPNWYAIEPTSTNPCVSFSNGSDPSPSHSTTVINLCSDSTPLTIDNSLPSITVNGQQGFFVTQNSNWGTSQSVFFTNPKGGSIRLWVLFGDYNIFNLMISTVKFQ